ncbi:hypothetical protein MCM47_27750 [Kitasatospora sp. A2-31]|nr:hypothetical protein [Kitasatospora sp. A2-31]
MGREDPWLARIEDTRGRVHGAGTMLDGQYVAGQCEDHLGLSLLTDRVTDDLFRQLEELGSPIVLVVNAVDRARRSGS